MPLDIPGITEKLNKLAHSHPIGTIQDIRAKLKKLKRRPGNKIFSVHTTFDDYAFHHGGRTELQFNIGYADGDENEDIRYGVAFSLELSQTLQSIDVLVPKIKLFNDFMEMNASEFSDMRMWYYNPKRSSDYPPGVIPSSLIKRDVFVFLGNRQAAKRIDYEEILNDFDRLLSLYQYVESSGATAPVPLPKQGFNFKPGYAKKVTKSKVNYAERELDLDLRHNILQQALYKQLVSKYGSNNVSVEQPSGVGTQIDLVVKIKNKYWFYEVKTDLTPRACLRAAIGQLLEYGFWPGAQEPNRFIVVGESQIDEDGKEYLHRLKTRFSMPIEYEAMVI